LYEYQKNQALKNIKNLKYSANIFGLLEKVYTPYFSKENQLLFSQQKAENLLDRFDLTILLLAQIQTTGGLFHEVTMYRALKNGEARKRQVLKEVKFGLMIIDEIQNYLPQQITALQSMADQKLRSIVYVGDLSQQTSLCVLRDWSDVGETWADERVAKLQKTYRSTQQILEYIKSMGYNIEIGDNLRTGPEVMDQTVKNKADEITYTKSVVEKNPNTIMGILAKTIAYLADYKAVFAELSNVHILTINESQGLEFDVVLLVGINEADFAIAAELEPDLILERQRINKDLIYVALSRAMNELHVLGTAKISAILAQ
jgi:DNA helicase-2/ATP-dependent DNA helicase PcrA